MVFEGYMERLGAGPVEGIRQTDGTAVRNERLRWMRSHWTFCF